MGISKDDYLGCYLCSKAIFERAIEGQGLPTSLGTEVVPTKDFSSVGICLTNERGEQADYSTPVCKDCNLLVTNEKNQGHRDALVGNLIMEVKKNNFGPRYLTSSKLISLVSIKDITDELKENGII